jgi:hypothetical protein
MMLWIFVVNGITLSFLFVTDVVTKLGCFFPFGLAPERWSIWVGSYIMLGLSGQPVKNALAHSLRCQRQKKFYGIGPRLMRMPTMETVKPMGPSSQYLNLKQMVPFRFVEKHFADSHFVDKTRGLYNKTYYGRDLRFPQ